MINIALPTERDLECFYSKKVVIFNYTKRTKQTAEILNHYHIDVVAFYSTTKSYTHKHQGIPIISLDKLIALSRIYSEIIVLFDNQSQLDAAKETFDNYNISCSTIFSNNLLLAFYPKMSLDLMRKNKYNSQIRQWKKQYYQKRSFSFTLFKLWKHKNPIVICSPLKTGDITLNDTFSKINDLNRNSDTNEKNLFSMIARFKRHGTPIQYINLFHRPVFIKKKECEKKLGKLRVITAVREPISQNLSSVCQIIAGQSPAYVDWIVGDYINNSSVIEQGVHCFIKNGNDVQRWFNSFIDRYVYSQNGRKPSILPRAIQEFISQFNEQVIDLFARPFDQEAGYAIIKEGNTEIFVYQLEKLNSIVPQLSEWVGVPFDKLEKGNVAEDKWIGDSYKQAQKEIQITQEYFDRCFNEPYVKHFYSEADIEKFKARWRPHIKHEN